MAALAATSYPAAPSFARDVLAVDVRAALQSVRGSGGDVAAFYKSRNNRPLWVRGSTLVPEADRVVRILMESDLDGFDVARYRVNELTAAIDAARSGDRRQLARAEILLSHGFSAYVRDLRRPADVGKIYVDSELAPKAPSVRAVLDGAASARSLNAYIEEAVRVNPVYAKLRDGYADWLRRGGGGAREQVIRANLERARAIPVDPGRRFILVDTAAAQLSLYADGRVQDTMRVIVGKRSEQTPMMAGLIRYVTFNPYWNVPPDLVQARIAANVLAQGLTYLRNGKYEVVSDWSDDAVTVNPSEVDWKAIAAGRRELPVRQLPGRHNMMGDMKFMFPNEQGIYLHDTPDKKLFRQADRRLSAGCVRVEDAARLSKWLFGKTMRPPSSEPEQNLSLREPVPVYITYFTAAPERGELVFRPDVYFRDQALMARLGPSGPATAP